MPAPALWVMTMAKLIDIHTAVDHIHQACTAPTPAASPPFFFMVGAGISAPNVPLAGEIIEECRRQAYTLGRDSPANRTDPIGRYSHWFQQALPQPIQRQQFLRGLVESTAITPATFRLAHLLQSRRSATVVVTTNFDDLLSKALNLLGQPHIACDHPATTQRINPEGPDIQIIHVHGTYWFYDCCNLDEEILERASQSKTPHGMAALLDRMLASRSPLVVGYSGWPGDVFMSALERRLHTSLPYNMYWFCHTRSALNDLPVFLIDHPNVVFVVPSQEELAPDAVSRRPAFPTGRRISMPAQELASIAEPLPERPSATLEALQVFDALLRAFDCPEPVITSDPLGHFSVQLKQLLLQAPPPPPHAGPYFLEDVVERVNRARAVDIRLERGLDEQLSAVRTAIREAKYLDALDAASSIDFSALTPTRRVQLFYAVLMIVLGLSDQCEYQVVACDLLLAIADLGGAPDLQAVGIALMRRAAALAQLGRLEDEVATYILLEERLAAPDNAVPSELVAHAILLRAGALRQLGRLPEAVATYDQLIRRLPDQVPFSLREVAATAMFRKARALGKMDRHHEEIATYEELLGQIEADPHPSLRALSAKALVFKGISLALVGRPNEAIPCFDAALRRYADAPEQEVRDELAGALFFKALAFGQLNQADMELLFIDEVIGKFGASRDPRVRDLIARAFLSKIELLARLGNHDEAVDAADVALRSLDHPESPYLLPHLAAVLLAKGNALATAGRHDETIRAYDVLLVRFGGASDAAVTISLADCLFRKGVALAAHGCTHDALAAFGEVVARFQYATESDIQLIVACALFHKAAALTKLARLDEAADTFGLLISLYASTTDGALRIAVAQTLVALGVLLARQGKSMDAEGYFLRAIPLLEECSAETLQLDKATAYAGSGEPVHAIEILQRTNRSAISPDDAVDFVRTLQLLAQSPAPPAGIAGVVSIALTTFPAPA